VPQEHFTPTDIFSLVSTHLPSWLRACDAADADAIALHESEFGSSAAELLLFACAIKTATKKGKNVYVIGGRVGSRDNLLSFNPHVVVYREKRSPSKKTSRPGLSRKNHA
jgi:hypothetical protein